MPKKPHIVVFTYIPSPYQVELFNAIKKENECDLTIGYIYGKSTTPIAQLWKQNNIWHPAIILNDEISNYAEIKNVMESADLVIFNYYQHPLIKQMIEERVNSRKAWCFWGERTGYRQIGYLGTLYRQWKFSELHRSHVPIWGIGNWAVEQYRKEFGIDRQYFNLPYFSDLKRFSQYKDINNFDERLRRFLYSGSLIHRKGVDLLASAFSQLADEFPFVRLTIMGEGNLRPRLEKQLAKYGDRVEFLGFQPWDHLPKFYQATDILCVPSRYDGWALVVPEGLAASLPVIGTNRTGAALELIKDNENGWLVPAADREALYQAMKKAALLSKDQLLFHSYLARMSVSEHSLEDGVKRFHNAIRETLNILP